MIYGVSKETQLAARHTELRRFDQPGHRASCNGIAELRIRFVEGKYRLALACACGTILKLRSGPFNSYADALARLRTSG